MLQEWILLQPGVLPFVDQDQIVCTLPAASKMSTSADQLQDVHVPAQPNQFKEMQRLPGSCVLPFEGITQPVHQDALSLLDVDQVYLEYEDGGATIINVDEIGPDAKKKKVESMEMIELCDGGIHKVVWQVPRMACICSAASSSSRTVDGDWQRL